MKIIKVVSLNSLCGLIAKYATQQSPYHCPDNLTEAIRLFYNAMLNETFELAPKDWPLIEACKVKDLLNKHLLTLHIVRSWNERKNGNKASFGFVSRFDKLNPDDDFIDLDALRMNVEREVYTQPEVLAFNFNV